MQNMTIECSNTINYNSSNNICTLTTADRPIDRPTDRQTDIATYRAAIAAKKDLVKAIKVQKPKHQDFV